MAQEFWDENKQQELKKELQELRKRMFLDWAKQVANTLTEEIDENTRKQLLEKVTDLLRKNNIDFKVENGNRVLIKGNVIYVSLPGYAGGYQEITIVQRDKEISLDVFLEASRLLVKSPETSRIDLVELPRDINVKYADGYLEIIF